MTEDGNPPGGTVENMEDLWHDQSYLPGSSRLAFDVHLLRVVEYDPTWGGEVSCSNLNLSQFNTKEERSDLPVMLLGKEQVGKWDRVIPVDGEVGYGAAGGDGNSGEDVRISQESLKYMGCSLLYGKKPLTGVWRPSSSASCA